MEQEVAVCSGCLSTDRNLVSINESGAVHQIFRLLMYEFAGDRYGDTLMDVTQLLCWECLALMKRFARFQRQVQIAQEHLRVLALSQTAETIDHTYMSQSLSSLETSLKADYDSIYVDIRGHTSTEAKNDWHRFITVSSSAMKSEEGRVPHETAEIILDDVSEAMPQIVIGPELVATEMSLDYGTEPVKGEVSELIIDPITSETTVILKPAPSMAAQPKLEKSTLKLGYTIEYMTEEEMLASREEEKKKIHYASSVYKCELCIIGYYSEQQVQDHFLTVHKGGPGYTACKVCYVYVEYSKLREHVEGHYTRYVCKLCPHVSRSEPLANQHAGEHRARAPPAALIQIADTQPNKGRKRKEKESDQNPTADVPKANIRKLLKKTTISGYKCLECDMFFKNSRARKNHAARVHRGGVQCDHCKKTFVNKTTLATHLRLHEGPLPREECPVCHKMVRSIQLKYHIRRHETKSRYECKECDKVFSHLTTYHAHLKYSRAHADEAVFKYPCPMCNKGYPTKESMQDHFNYQHLGKTTHKCPICSKPIASRANVDKHMMRVHGKKKEKPRNHICPQCNKAFTDKKALKQHCVIHSSERPLVCEVCHQSFKQKASLYTHRKRVHKLAPAKRTLTFMQP